MKMDSVGGVSLSSKRSGSGGRSEHSSETQGCFIGKVGEERDGVAPKCHCGVYAILYRSRTSTNPNRLFFGCPFFKVSIPHCKYFLWLDKHTSKVGAVSGDGADEAEDVNQHFSMIQVENKVAALECRVSAIEKKRNFVVWVIVVCTVAVLVAIYLNG